MSPVSGLHGPRYRSTDGARDDVASGERRSAAGASPDVRPALSSTATLPSSTREHLDRAAVVLAEQIRLARAACLAAGLPPTAEVLPAIVQALATDFLAESARDQAAFRWPS